MPSGESTPLLRMVTTDSTREHRTMTQRTVKLLKKRLPITQWLPRYQKSDLVGDIIAGITVGMTVVPQSMAYAAIAGLTPEYGLYSSYWGVLLYTLLGSCRQATVGPTAVMALLTYQTCGQSYPACVVLTGFYAGIFELLMAILQLGWVVSFISEPVTVGFTAGAAMTILSSQVGSLFGLSGKKGDSFITYWKAIFTNITTIRTGDAVLGVTSFIVLCCLRKLKDVKAKNKRVGTAFWLISLSRNVIVILVTSLISFLWKTPPFKIVGNVQGGFPPVAAPEIFLSYRPTVENDTIIPSDEHYNFFDTWSILKTGPLIIALISVLQNVAISKAFGAGQAVDATQEMLALGAGSVAGSFFSSIPISASFSRSAVNEASGVRSQLAGTFTGILVLLSLNFLTSSFYWIPKSSLAAVIIGAVIIMIDYESVLPMWRISKLDCASCLITFVAAMGIGMEYGILVGVGISIGALLLKSLRPTLSREVKCDPTTNIDYILVTPENGLNFPSVDHITTSIQKLTVKHKECSLIILDFSKWTVLDYTGANTFNLLSKGMKKNEKTLAFLKCSQNWIDAFKIGGMSDPPLIRDEDHISQFIQERMKKIAMSKNYGTNGKRPSLDSVIVGGADRNNIGMMEGVGAISVASSGGSTSDVASLASSTKPII